MKCALIQIRNISTYDEWGNTSSNPLLIKSITNWMDLSEKDIELLRSYTYGDYLVVTEHTDEIPTKLEEILAQVRKKEEKEQKRILSLQKDHKEKEKQKREKALEKARKLLKEAGEI